MVAGLAAALLLQAAAPASRASLDSVFDGLRSGPPAPALAMMVTHRGQVVYQNVAGYADLERRVPATLETRFDVASIAKQFTAFAVSRLVQEGRIAPGDPVARHLPGLDLDGARITVDQLLHHTSGFEDSDGLMVLAGWRPGDVVPFPDLVRLLLAQRHLRFAPGEQHFYSNGGYVLLAEIVQRLAGVPFERYCDSTIFGPLGMRSSGFAPDPGALIPNRALPYARTGGRLEASRTDRYPGAGGLFTTVGDLSRWAAHLMRPARDSAATMRLRERGRLASGEPVEYAWGIGAGTFRGQLTLSHAGSGPATEAQFVTFPDLDFSVVVVASGPTGSNPSALAYRAAEIFLGDRLAPPDPPGNRRMIMITEEQMNARPAESAGVIVAPDRLARIAGAYRLGDDDPPMIIRERDGGLEYSWGGRAPYFPLFPLADGGFVMVPLWDVYRFVGDSGGHPTGIVREKVARSLRQRGPDRVPGVRLPDPPRFDSAAAAPYLGWYFGDETGTFYQVLLRDGRLVLRHARLGEFPLVPLGDERFGIDARLIAGVRFARAGARITGMELEAYSWSVTSSFRKVGDW